MNSKQALNKTKQIKTPRRPKCSLRPRTHAFLSRPGARLDTAHSPGERQPCWEAEAQGLPGREKVAVTFRWSSPRERRSRLESGPLHPVQSEDSGLGIEEEESGVDLGSARSPEVWWTLGPQRDHRARRRTS